MTPALDSREFRLDTRPHFELCPCGKVIHHHGPVTPEHAAWCRWLAARQIGPNRTLLGEDHERCAKAFPGMTLIGRGK